MEEWHEWSLVMGKGANMLTRFLWQDVSNEDREKAEKILEEMVNRSFEVCYIANEGAFSYYPDAKHATLDGTGKVVNEFYQMGYFSQTTQHKLWGNVDEQINSKITMIGFDILQRPLYQVKYEVK